jgi:hypothetical protein
VRRSPRTGVASALRESLRPAARKAGLYRLLVLQRAGLAAADGAADGVVGADLDDAASRAGRCRSAARPCARRPRIRRRPRSRAQRVRRAAHGVVEQRLRIVQPERAAAELGDDLLVARMRDLALLAAPPLGDVRAHAAVADEAAAREHRLAADRDVALVALGVDAREAEVAERQARVADGLVRGPACGVGPDARQVPRRLADQGLRRIDPPVAAAVDQLGDPVLGVGLPVEIGKHHRQAAEALLALSQLLLGFLAVRDVLDDRDHVARPAVGAPSPR